MLSGINLSKVNSDSAFRDAVSKRINQRCDELGLKQTDLVKKLNVPKSTVNGWFTGVTQPKGFMLTQLSIALKCSLEWLLSGVGSTVSPLSGFTLDGFPGTWEFPGAEMSPYVRVPRLDTHSLSLSQNEIKLFSTSHIDVDPEKLPGLCWALCNGKASAPVIDSGDLVLIDSSVKCIANSGSYYLFSYGGSIHIHRVFINVDGSLTLEDTARPNSPIIIAPSDIAVAGKVIYSMGVL